MQTLVVFSHLRWDFVYQRPQHLMTALARSYQVLFIEEPMAASGPPSLRISEPAPGVRVYQPLTPLAAPGFHDDQLPILRALLTDLVPPGTRPVVWLYTPMALPLVAGLDPGLVVYDCMDELAAFKNAPRQLLQRETALLKVADLVFAGGPSLYEAKRSRHPRVHCFPSSVDATHFGQARQAGPAHPAQAGLPGPRLGYAGVIDERFDAELVGALAAAQPDWQIVLVGPVVKIDPDSLPRGPNLHYLGQQPYADLPRLFADWDVCLMPFALNEATRYISPTKVLEYMAAGKPVVSTPIRDVAEPYSELVAIAGDAPSFIAACRKALALSADEAQDLAARMEARVAATSWDATARAMEALLHETAPAGRIGDLQPAAATPPASKRGPTRALGAPCVVVGAGPTGLSAAYHLGTDALLLEREERVGGWCRSVQSEGFTFDYAGHIMFSNDAYVQELYRVLLGDNIHWQDREAWVFSKGVYTRYPFQGSLYGLPPGVIKECLLGAIAARYGQNTNGTASCAHEDCCADGGLELASGGAGARAPANFEQFIHAVWGDGIARHFALPYNRKLWTVPLNEMETSWLGGRVPLPDLEAIIDGALAPTPRPMGPNARFGYPRRGGFQALMDGFLPHLRGPVRLGADVAQVLPAAHALVLSNGERISYEQLISTMPLPELIRRIGNAAPPAIQAAAAALRHVSVRCVNLGIDRPDVSDKHWIYYPEDTIFHRIFVQGNASPECNAPGGFGLTCEISYSPTKPLPCSGEALVARCVADAVRVGLLRPEDRVRTSCTVDMPYAYVLYDHARAQNVATIRAWLAAADIVLAGRYAEWEYYNSDHAFLAGKRAAEQVQGALGSAASGRRVER